jgi:WD40 repeat protein
LALAISPDGRNMFSGATDGIARLWRVPAGGTPISIEHARSISGIAFSPDGRHVLTGSNDHTARLWDVETGKPVGQPMQHDDIVTFVAFSPSGRTVLTASNDAVHLWDAQTGISRREPSHFGGLVRAAQFINDDHLCLAVGERLNVRLIDFPSGRMRGQLVHDHEVFQVAFSHAGDLVATTSSDLRVRLWKIQDCKATGREFRHDSPVLTMAFSPDGHNLVCGCNENTAYLWDVDTGRQVGVLTHASSIFAAAFSPNGRTILTGSQDREARLWDVFTGKLLSKPLMLNSTVTSVAFNPDGHTLLTGCEDGTVWKWNAPPSPLPSSPQLVAAWAKSRTGMVLEDQRVPRRLSQAEWLRATDELEKLRGDSELP